MPMIRLRKSRFGLVLAGAFLALAAVLFVMHVVSMKTNQADSGESALWFFLLTLPWAYLLPEAVIDAPWWDRVAYGAGWALVAFNAFLLYCVGGGLGFRRRERPVSR
jgi:hypothetical protein